MKRSIPVFLGFVLIAGLGSPAWAQRRGNVGVTTPFGTFSAQEMLQAGGDPSMASQMREQRQMLQYQQQWLRQNQTYLQNQAKQQDFLKKHPEAAKALNASGRTAKKAASKTEKTDKKAKTQAPTTTPAATKAAKAN